MNLRVFKILLVTILMLANWPALAAINGHIDSVNKSNGKHYINGWACDTGVNRSIRVHMYAGGPYGEGEFVKEFTANRGNEAAVNNACNTGGVSHRFRIELTNQDRTNFVYKTIHLHGISRSGQANSEIGRSGQFRMPAANGRSLPSNDVEMRQYDYMLEFSRQTQNNSIDDDPMERTIANVYFNESIGSYFDQGLNTAFTLANDNSGVLTKESNIVAGIRSVFLMEKALQQGSLSNSVRNNYLNKIQYFKDLVATKNFKFLDLQNTPATF